MARVLVTEQLAPAGLERLAEAGHEVDVRLGLSPEELVEAVVGAHALIIRSATMVTAEVLAAGTDLVVVGRGGDRPRQRRRVGGDRAGDHGRQRAAVEHPLCRRAGDGPPARSGPQHPTGARRAGRREVGTVQVGGGRAPRQGPRHRRARPGRGARRAAGARLRDAPRRLRPVRLGRTRPPHGRGADGSRGAHGRIGLRDGPPPEERRDDGADRQGPPREGEAGSPDRQHRPRRNRRRGRRWPKRSARGRSRAPGSTSSPRSRRPSRPSSSSPRWSSPPTSALRRPRPRTKQASPSPNR